MLNKRFVHLSTIDKIRELDMKTYPLLFNRKRDEGYFLDFFKENTFISSLFAIVI